MELHFACSFPPPAVTYGIVAILLFPFASLPLLARAISPAERKRPLER
jgi:hypothetical protein